MYIVIDIYIHYAHSFSQQLIPGLLVCQVIEKMLIDPNSLVFHSLKNMEMLHQ